MTFQAQPSRSSSRLFIIVLAILALTGCKKDPSLWEISNLNGGSIGVFGHGGMGSKYRYPMNSMRSLNDVLELDVMGTEMDVQLSRDNELVLFHPQKLEDATGCDGMMRDKNLSEISDCKYRQPITTNDAAVITAKAFFEQRPDLSRHFFVFDTKISADASQSEIGGFATALYALIQSYHLEERCFIESYNFLFLRALQAKNSALKLFIHSDSYRDGLEVLKYVKLYGLTMDRTRISAAEIAAAHARGLRIALFNLETEAENLEGAQMDPDYMQSDKCKFLLDALR